MSTEVILWRKGFFDGLVEAIPELSPKHRNIYCIEFVVEPGKDVLLKIKESGKGLRRDYVVIRTYSILNSNGTPLNCYEFVRELKKDFPWLKGLCIPEISLVNRGGILALSLTVELDTPDGKFHMGGPYTLSERNEQP